MHSGIASHHEVVQFCLRIVLKQGQFLNVFEQSLLCSPRQYSEISDIMNDYYNLKYLFSF